MSVMEQGAANFRFWDHAAGMAVKVAARNDVPDRLRLAHFGDLRVNDRIGSVTRRWRLAARNGVSEIISKVMV